MTKEIVAHALLRAASALMPTLVLCCRPDEYVYGECQRRLESRRGTLRACATGESHAR
jgi:hypothetical protein